MIFGENNKDNKKSVKTEKNAKAVKTPVNTVKKADGGKKNAKTQKKSKYGIKDYGKGGLFVIGKIFGGIMKVVGIAMDVILTLVLILVITAVIVGCVFATYIGNFIDADVEEFEMLSSSQNRTTIIYCYDNSGNLVEVAGGRLYSSENRVWAGYEEIPENLKNAFIAIEDKRFEEHNGVDWKMTIRALVYYAIGQSDRGGSSITQQLIKNVTGENERTIQRKAEEIFRALNLEKVKSKEEILEMYLNTVYFSQGSYGVESASQTYFGKSVDDLTLIECAALAGIVQNPSKWDPKLHPDNNTERRNDILYEMLDQGKITQLEYDEAINSELVIYNHDDDEEEEEDDNEEISANVTSWYLDEVINDAVELFMAKYNVTKAVATQMVYSGGYSIYIAMDPDVQDAMESVYENDKLFNSVIGAGSSIMQPQSAMVIIDPTSGNLLGIVGGRGEKTQSRLFNYATMATRQPGSSIKPLATYSLALEKGIINYSTVFDDSPFEILESTGSSGKTVYTAWPANATGRYLGLTALNDGITRSVNTIAVRTMNALGVEESFNFLTKTLCLSTLVDRQVVNNTVVTDKGLAQLAIGGLTFGVTVEELTAGYTMFTNDGMYVSPRTILEVHDSDGNRIIDNKPVENVALSVENAALMRQILTTVTNNPSGTGYGTKMASLVATGGKTGTTNKNYDKWFVGFTPYYIGGVWFGYETQQTLSGFSGNPAVKIWDAVMLKVHEKIFANASETGEPLKQFTMPDTIVKLTYCKDSGLIATDACRLLDTRGDRTATGYYTADNIPTEFCTTHVVVRYCTVGHGVASEYCPDDSCIKVALIKETKRDYPYNVSITDAQYTYRSLTVGNKVYAHTNGAFYLNELESGHYAGASPAVSTPYNHYCTVHYSGQPYGLSVAASKQISDTVLSLPPDDKMKLAS